MKIITALLFLPFLGLSQVAPSAKDRPAVKTAPAKVSAAGQSSAKVSPRLPAVNVAPRVRGRAELTRADIVAHPHGIFSLQVQARGFEPVAIVRVDAAPPAPLPATFGLPHPPGWVYLPGYWLWAGNEYVWIEPTYAPPPAAGVHWIAPRWVQQDDGTWSLQEGYWIDPSGQ